MKVFSRSVKFAVLLVLMTLLLTQSQGFAQANPFARPPDCFSLYFNPYTAGCLPTGPYYNSYYAMSPPWLQAQAWQALPPNPLTPFPSFAPYKPLDFSIYNDMQSSPSLSSTARVVSSSPTVNQLTVQTEVFNRGAVTNQVKTNILPLVAMVNTHEDPNCHCTFAPQPNMSEPDVTAATDVASCKVHKVTSLPGSHQEGSDFIESIAADPQSPETLYGISLDMGSRVATKDQGMYISKSPDGGKTWVRTVKLDSNYYNQSANEGLYNRISVSNGGKDIVVTTQKGAYAVSDNTVIKVDGPRFEPTTKRITAEKPGDPVPAGDVKVSPNGQDMVVTYGFYDDAPQVMTYHKTADGSWGKGTALPAVPKGQQILSAQLDPHNSNSYYVGTGDGAYHFDSQTQTWKTIQGIKSDSAIQSISTTGGLHMVSCWGVFQPSATKDTVVKTATKRASSIEINPNHLNQEVVTTSKGVYTSNDGGKTLTLVKDLPPGEFRTAHIDPVDNSVVVSGINGTYLINPFNPKCTSSKLRY